MYPSISTSIYPSIYKSKHVCIYPLMCSYIHPFYPFKLSDKPSSQHSSLSWQTFLFCLVKFWIAIAFLLEVKFKPLNIKGYSQLNSEWCTTLSTLYATYAFYACACFPLPIPEKNQTLRTRQNITQLPTGADHRPEFLSHTQTYRLFRRKFTYTILPKVLGHPLLMKGLTTFDY